MADNAFQYQHRVTYAECTAGNHIYYSRYLDLLEAARGEFFRHLGTPLLEWQRQEVIFPVIECRVRYQAPARYDDVLTIEVRPAVSGPVRLNFAYRVLKSGAPILEAETFHACTGFNEKPRRIPETLAELLKPWLASAK
jgi:acyl-CoA thioester hydrolase